MDDNDFEEKKKTYELLRQQISFCEDKEAEYNATAGVFALYKTSILLPTVINLEKELTEEWKAREKAKDVKAVSDLRASK